jgi:hypothetical protein
MHPQIDKLSQHVIHSSHSSDDVKLISDSCDSQTNHIACSFLGDAIFLKHPSLSSVSNFR